MTNVLVSWVGNADISGANQEEFSGPLASIIAANPYDIVYLIHDKPVEEVCSVFVRVTDECEAELKPRLVGLTSPIHFGDIYTAFDSVMSEAVTGYPKARLDVQLSSGTPAMSAVSILVGKTKYSAHFIQSSKEQGVQEADIPFDIAADFLPVIEDKNNRKLAGLIANTVPDIVAFENIITQNSDMERLKQRAAILAQRDVPVLIYGETGTGKELFAKAIHNSSLRADKPFFVLNCGAIPSELIDSTLFGHSKGAFTGANESRKGYFEQADSGTLFLDEFGELPLDAQVRLLRVLQDGTFTPVGTTKEKTVNIRIITATNKNLAEEIAEGRFREDLFYRVAIGVLHLPPLKERKGDLGLLADKLMEQVNQEATSQPGYEHKKISVKAKNVILGHHWPGNVRELHATILRASLWNPGDTLTDVDIKEAMLKVDPARGQVLDKPLDQAFDINEVISNVSTHYIERALVDANGSKTKAAELLGLKNYQTLNNWIDKYRIKTDRITE